MGDRAIGLEMEYSLAHVPAPGVPRVGSERLSELAVKVAGSEVRRGGSAAHYFWPNGGKLYYDVGHVEWAGPECRGARDVVCFDRAGELLLDRIATALEPQLEASGTPGRVFVAKNNIDTSGNTFGCHENYLVSRQSRWIDDGPAFFTYLVRHLVPFLVSRIVYSGNGALIRGAFHLSQRALFINRTFSGGTREDRAIVNGREQAHADERRHRRLHLILGDANMAEWSTYLKVGTTALVLDLIEDAVLDRTPELVDPVAALHRFSSDPTLTATARTLQGHDITALAIQRWYLHAAEAYFHDAASAETAALLRAWRDTLDRLDKDPASLVGWIDWVTKRFWLESYAPNGAPDFSSPLMREMDLKYHGVRRDDSVFQALKEAGLVHEMIPEREVERALDAPPSFTRARVRAAAIARGFAVADWDQLAVPSDGNLPEPLDWCAFETLRRIGLDDLALWNWARAGLDADSPDIRCEALRHVVELDARQALSALERALQDPVPRVRATAAEQLGELPGPLSSDLLRDACTDAHYSVRFAAVAALQVRDELHPCP